MSKKPLTEKMMKASEELQFERAKDIEIKLLISKRSWKSKNSVKRFCDRDVFGYAYDKGWMCVQVFFIDKGN